MRHRMSGGNCGTESRIPGWISGGSHQRNCQRGRRLNPNHAGTFSGLAGEGTLAAWFGVHTGFPITPAPVTVRL